MLLYMDFAAYKRAVGRLAIGKKLPDAIYLHRCYMDSAPAELVHFVSSIVNKHGGGFEWNVIKLSRRDFRLTLLSYPEFDRESYPPLHASLTIDLVRSTVRKTHFRDSKNPPILHRKETLVPCTHPRFQHFAEITKEGEEAGLYDNSHKIGFKNNWERTISQKGYALIDGRIVRQNDHSAILAERHDSEIEVQRHLTAVDRDKLSTPMQSLARHGYLDGDHSILDYGCGKGHDLLELEAHGLDAVGWDPAFRPDGAKRPSDLVNLGFVVNVIEDREERSDALRQAFALAKRILVVSVMLGGEATTQKFRPYKDGVITSRGTFQKYYAQAEIRDFIEKTLSIKAVPVGPGLFYIFKDELEEQEFLVRRQRVKRQWNQLVVRDRLSPSVDYQAVIEANLDLFKEFWATCLDFGRPPANDEFERSAELRRVIGSHRKAVDASKEYFGDQDFEASITGRKKDLTVFLALSFFDRHGAYSKMPISLQRDFRAFFGKPSFAYDFAKQALFAIANTEMVVEACENAFRKIECGRMADGHQFTFYGPLLSELPPLLRIFVGCAAQLYGDLADVQLVKIHALSGKVTFLKYRRFASRLPCLTERVKVNLKTQHVDIFQYDDLERQQPLLFKGDYLPPSLRQGVDQDVFDAAIRRLEINVPEYEITLSVLRDRIYRLGIKDPTILDTIASAEIT